MNDTILPEKGDPAGMPDRARTQKAGLWIRLATTPKASDAAKVEKLFSGPFQFLKGVTSEDGMPGPDRIEVCLAGRSNVGKSSLINALANRKRIARTSNTPGRTQEINFFKLGSSHYLVDLPGYGYARMPKPAAERCQRIMRSYLRGRMSLRRVFVLIDARHGPKPIDESFLDLLDSAAVPFQIVFTKVDKVGREPRSSLLDLASPSVNGRAAGFPEVIATSASTGEGIETLRLSISSI